jgi:cell division ATPase FtsA
MTELGEEVFHMPVRVGVPTYSGGLADVVKSPRYATTVGLLLEGTRPVPARAGRARTGYGYRRRCRTHEELVQSELLTIPKIVNLYFFRIRSPDDRGPSPSIAGRNSKEKRE